MPENARRRRAIDTGGPWGTGLLLVGVAEVALGVNYATAARSELPDALAWVEAAFPLKGWALLWIGAGLFAVMRALNPPQPKWQMAFPVAPICLWAGFYAAYWLLEDIHSRAWTSAVAWGALAAVLISFGRCNNPPTGRATGRRRR